MQVQFQILSESEKQVIHEKSLRILNEIGVMFHSQKARRILKTHGAKMNDETGITRIPEELVKQVIARIRASSSWRCLFDSWT